MQQQRRTVNDDDNLPVARVVENDDTEHLKQRWLERRQQARYHQGRVHHSIQEEVEVDEEVGEYDFSPIHHDPLPLPSGCDEDGYSDPKQVWADRTHRVLCQTNGE